MELDRAELKSRARELMGDTQPRFWLVALTYLALTSGFSLLLTAISTFLQVDFSVDLFFYFLSLLLPTVIAFGYLLWNLEVVRGQPTGIGSLFNGFSMALRVVLLDLGVGLTIGCISFLAIFPASFIFAMVVAVGSWGAYIVTFVAFIIYAFLVVYFIGLRYALAPYVLADNPDGGVRNAMRQSKNLMDGWKTQLFRLELSFFGWYALEYAVVIGVAVVCGRFFPSLAMSTLASQPFEYFQAVLLSLPVQACTLVLTLPLSLWLTPYLSLSHALFYTARMEALAPPVLPSSYDSY